jgi:hypothetical protein
MVTSNCFFRGLATGLPCGVYYRTSYHMLGLLSVLDPR